MFYHLTFPRKARGFADLWKILSLDIRQAHQIVRNISRFQSNFMDASKDALSLQDIVAVRRVGMDVKGQEYAARVNQISVAWRGPGHQGDFDSFSLMPSLPLSLPLTLLFLCTMLCGTKGSQYLSDDAVQDQRIRVVKGELDEEEAT